MSTPAIPLSPPPLAFQTVFSKTYCPFCTKAKTALRDVLGPRAEAAMTIVELDQRGDGAAIQGVMGPLTGATSVPRVFIGGKFIGGGDDTVALAKSGELKRLIDAALAA